MFIDENRSIKGTLITFFIVITLVTIKNVFFTP
jgi:hypothetical protein